MSEFTEGRKAMLAKKRAKIPLQLVPVALNVAAAKALAEGAATRGAYNWRDADPDNPTEATTLIGGIMRHLGAWAEGEELDPDSPTGKHHLDGVAGLLAILLDCRAIGNLIDDRKPGPAPKLVLPLFVPYAQIAADEGCVHHHEPNTEKEAQFADDVVNGY